MAVKIDLEGDIAVVTGGAQGIGFAIAKRLVEAGAKVSLWDVNADLLKIAAAALGSTVSTRKVDITRLSQVEAAAAAVKARHGKLSILVNSAGIAGPNAPIVEYPVDMWKKVIDVNLTGTFHVNRAVVPHMLASNYGRIVNIASIAGKEGNPNAGPYSASKAGVIGFTKALGKELATTGIAVNCITPAAARTPIFEQLKEEFISYMLSKIPRGRFVEPDEIAAMVCWLVSRENSFTTAAVFDLSGGRATY